MLEVLTSSSQHYSYSLLPSSF